MLPVVAIIFLIFKVVVSFSLLILFHELGHFLVAKKSGVWVEEFGLGLPPRIFGKKIGDTVYTLNWLPIGGFVKLHGETSSDQIVYPDRAFTKKSKPVKIAITIAGIIMNFFLAIICFGIIFFFVGIPGKVNLVITGISPNSPAQKAGFMKKDIITKINGVDVVDDDSFKNEIQSKKGEEISIVVKRDNDLKVLQITPRVNPPEGEGSLGVEFADQEESYFPPLWQRPFVAAWYGVKETFNTAKAVTFGLGGAVKSVSVGESPKGLGGPLLIIAILQYFAQLPLLGLIGLIGSLSVNLAIVNLIPFPPLDGSRVALVIVEWITKKKMSAKLEEKVYLAGFAILIGLMILITAHDIPSLIKAGSLNKYAEQFLNQSQK